MRDWIAMYSMNVNGIATTDLLECDILMTLYCISLTSDIASDMLLIDIFSDDFSDIGSNATFPLQARSETSRQEYVTMYNNKK